MNRGTESQRPAKLQSRSRNFRPPEIYRYTAFNAERGLKFKDSKSHTAARFDSAVNWIHGHRP